jgi:hypothetical protein
MIDYIILALIAFFVILAFRKILLDRKKAKDCGIGSSCAGCSHAHQCNKLEKKDI